MINKYDVLGGLDYFLIKYDVLGRLDYFLIKYDVLGRLDYFLIKYDVLGGLDYFLSMHLFIEFLFRELVGSFQHLHAIYSTAILSS